MKLRALNRNPWDDFDIWQGRYKGHTIEIELPYREISKYGGGYRVTIKFNKRIVFSSIKEELTFDELEKARESSIEWITKVLEKAKEE